MFAVRRCLARLSAARLTLPYEKATHSRVRVEINEAIYGMQTCRQYAAFLKDNLALLSERDMATIVFLINSREIGLDQSFREVVLPVLAEHIKVYGREHVDGLTSIATNLAEMEVKDPSVWASIEDKLVGERLYRYVPVKRAVDLASSLLRVGLGSNALLSCLNDTIMSHAKYLAAIPEYASKVRTMLPGLEKVEAERQQLAGDQGPKQIA